MNQFRNAWNFYLSNWQYFALLAAPIFAIEIVTAQLIMPIVEVRIDNPQDMAEFVEANGSYLLLLTVLGVIAGVSFIGGLFAAFDSKSSNYELDPMSALFKGFKKFFPLFGAYILSAIAVFFGLILLILPGVYVGARLALYPSYMMIENKSVMDSLKLSWEATDEHGGILFGLTLLFILITVVPALVFQFLIAPGLTQIIILAVIEYVVVIPWAFVYFSLYLSQRNQ